MQDVTQTRQAVQWLSSNMALFTGDVLLPCAAELDDAAVQQWVARAEQDDAIYEQLRDATLVDFSSEDDLLFMRLMSSMNIAVNVSLHGQEYILNNAYMA